MNREVAREQVGVKITTCRSCWNSVPRPKPAFAGPVLTTGCTTLLLVLIPLGIKAKK